jgi:AraC-like DNA-binding protein
MPIQIHWPSNPDFFGVAFHPLAIKKILRIPPAEYANRAIDLTLIHPEFNSLWHELAEQKTFADRVAIITRWVEGHLVELHPQEQLLNDTLLQIRPAQLTIPALAAALYYSPRHLSRKIRDITDMNSEEFLHYKKFSYAVHLLHHSDLSLTAIAHECHFADQSHFIKTFHKFADRTPGAYKQQKSMLPGHIFEDVR